MPDVTFLLDAPELPTSEIQIAKLGSYEDPRYGAFTISEGDVAAWAKNLEKLPGGKALIDFDHLSDKPSPHRRTEAAGWLTGISLQDGIPKARVEWTPLGKSAIEEGRYRFFSPAYGDFRDETGTLHENVLTGGALSNKPFIGSMSQVTLASDENVKGALLDDPGAGLYQLALDGSLGEDVRTLAGVTQDERDKAKEEGNSLADGSYPIRNVKQLKAAAVLAASKHGDWKAALVLIRHRAKELGVDINTLAGFGGDGGKTLDGAPETTELLEGSAAELEDSNAVTMLRVYQALEAVLGVNYAGAENVWRNGKVRVNRQANVAELLEAGGLNREQISQVGACVAILEANAAAERQQITDAAPLAERDRVYAGQALGVPEAVYLAPDFDHGTMANPEEHARRLARARANDIGGLYAGDEGAERFHAEDKQAVEVGLDLPRSLERRTEIKRARAIAKNETGALPQIAATTSARTEARTLEAEIRKLGERVETEDAERVDLKRRKVWRSGLAPHSGALLAARREKQMQLDDLQQSRVIRLENIPGFKIALEQPVGWKKLLASELTGAAPASPFNDEAIAAERQEIDRRARLYLLEHELPAENYLEAVAVVEADRDRPDPPAPFKRPALVKAEGTKLLDGDLTVQRARDYCEQRGWAAGDGKAFLKALDAVMADEG